METRKKQGRSQIEAEEARKLLEKSKDSLSDFQSYSSSSGEGGYDDSYDSDDGFVVQGQYADFEPEKKQTLNKKSKKGSEVPVQKTTLFSLLEKQSGSSTKKKAKDKPIKEANNDDHDLDLILQKIELDDEEDPRKKKSKKKNQQKAPMPDLVRKRRENILEDDEDISLPPPQTNLQEYQTHKETNNLTNSIENEEISTEIDVTSQITPPTTNNTSSKKNNKQERLTNFDLQKVEIESLALTDDEIKTFQKIEIAVPSDETMDLYMYHVHEENNNLYLFCKYKYKGKYYTICIMVGLCYYNLQFLPIPGHEAELEEEVEQKTRKAKFNIIKKGYEDKKYAFDKLNIPKFTKWYCVQLTPKGDLSQIPQEGDHYSEVFGLTSTLTERFLLEKRIYGPTWIRATGIKKLNQYTTCPMFSIKDVDSITILPENQLPDEHVPPFNICTFALQKVIDSKNNPQIVMAAMNILYYWNIETFMPFQEKDKTPIKSMIFVCPKKDESLSSEYVRSVQGRNVVICKNETDLITKFVEQLELYDIDLISSFGLNNVDIPLIYDKLVQHKVKTWYLLGRVKHVSPKKGKFDISVALAGRIPVDVRVSCIEFLKLKVNDFSTIVKDKFNVNRQNLENLDISKKMSSKPDLENLVNFTLRDSNLVMRLIKENEILPLSLQISKLSACPWLRVLLGSSSPRCETLLLQRFFAANYILPEKIFSKTNEPLKKEAKYKGGKVLDPIRGFYDTCILVLDFNSLYPSIIREYNICFSTVDKEHPDAYKSKNSKVNGIIPQIMTYLLEPRNEIKKQRKKLQEELKTANRNVQDKINIEINRLNVKEKAIKLLANSMYGYLGYKNSRFQSQELASLITSQGRSILEDTVKTMVNMCGSESAVIYGDTDSVMVNSSVTDIDQANKKAEELSNAISKKYQYLKLGIDYIFLKMLLVQKKKYAALVYKGEQTPPEFKASGLDMVRRDWSILTRKLSDFIIKQFMKDMQEKDQAINNILTELEAISSMLHNNGKALTNENEEDHEETIKSLCYPKEIPITDLLINKALKSNIEQYQSNSKNPPHVTVALRMKEQGTIKKQGDTISYYIVKADTKDISSKACFKEEVNDDFSKIDVDWYLTNQLLHPLWRLCEPFGQMQLSQISNALGCRTQVPLDNLPTDTEYNPCYNIPRITELTFICRGCDKLIRMTSKYSQCLKCPRAECGYQNNWKDVANQLTDFVKKFLTDPRMKESAEENPKLFGCDGYLCTYKTVQLPLSTRKVVHTNGYKNKDHEVCHGGITNLISPADIFNTLRYFKALFKTPNKDDDVEMTEFRQYMYRIMDYYYQNHDFSRLNFKSLFRGDES